MGSEFSRRNFIQATAAGGLAIGIGRPGRAEDKPIPGFESVGADPDTSNEWTPVSDRKIRVGLVGYGLCKFSAAFGFQSHPNVEIYAVSDLIEDRCAELAKAVRCERTYPSLEKLVEDDKVEAVFIATDAPNHARHAIATLAHGKHVACAVPACFGSLEEADQLMEAVKAAAGLHYMMFETSCFHRDLFEMRELYKAGALGEILYAEGEYYHYMPEPLDSYQGWRIGLPPQWYPTHSNAYHIGVTGGSFTQVSCIGAPSTIPHLTAGGNRYKNPFGTEIALFRTREGGAARMAVSWDTPGAGGEQGRIRGRKGSFYGKFSADGGVAPAAPKLPPLPPAVAPGGHGGSHGYLMNEFVTAVLEDRKPLVDAAMALNMTVSGIVAHESALKDGELLNIPQYAM